MTTTTIWRARCRDCGLEQRRRTEPRRRNDAHNDLFCHDCVHPIEWQRWEVSEERGWACGDSGIIGESDAQDRASMFGMRARRVVRRTLRRVRG